MKIQFLISTMNRENFDFLYEMFPNNLINEVSAIVVNQCTSIRPTRDVAEFNSKIKIFSVLEKGLSKSRNLALSKSTADICIVSDDDFIYTSDCIDIITKAYIKLKCADIITFQCKSIDTGKLRKKYPQHITKRGIISASTISSCDITFRRESLVESKIVFDENFGLGAKNWAAEDNILIADSIYKKLLIYSYPSVIVSTSDLTTGFQMLNYPEIRGVIFKRLYRNYLLLFILIWISAIRKYSYYKSNFSFIEYLILLIKGAYAK